MDYLKRRASHLTDQQKIVTLILDEIYTAQRMEYSNGKFIGITGNGEPAKTVVAFMVQSTSCEYKEVVCLVPVLQLTAAMLEKHLLVAFALKKNSLNPNNIARTSPQHALSKYILLLVDY